MKIIFFGLGSIGKRHARLIKDNFGYELYAFRSNHNSEKNQLGIPEIYNLEEIDTIKPDIAFITNPTSEHISYALYCAKKGIKLFIEKPLSNDQKNIQELMNEVKNKQLVAYTAYNLRFHPAIMWLKRYMEKKNEEKKKDYFHVTVNTSSYLPSWRKNINHLNNYSAFRGLGGGAILDLSHEIDYLYYLFGNFKEIKVNSRKLSDVTVDSEDFADILLYFDCGMQGNVHINFFSRLLRREMIIDFSDETIIIDLINHNITILKDKEKKVINFDLEIDDIYTAQLKYFFDNIDNKQIMNNLEESVKIFDVILKIRDKVEWRGN
jgi:predicted dehydrogenase